MGTWESKWEVMLESMESNVWVFRHWYLKLLRCIRNKPSYLFAECSSEPSGYRTRHTHTCWSALQHAPCTAANRPYSQTKMPRTCLRQYKIFARLTTHQPQNTPEPRSLAICTEITTVYLLQYWITVSHSTTVFTCKTVRTHFIHYPIHVFIQL